MTYRFADVVGEMQYHFDHIVDSFPLKALVATIPSAFAASFGGDWRFFETWFVLSVFDLFLGVALALKTPGAEPGQSAFSRDKLYGWAVKMLTHTCTILLFGSMTIMLSVLTGYKMPIIDWFVFILALTEAASIVKSADGLGLPVHPLAKRLLEKLRVRAAAKINDLANDRPAPKEDKK
jgi:phage-related holin